MLAAVTAFLGTQLGKYVAASAAALVLAASIFGFVHHLGVEHEKKAETARTAALQKQVAKREVKAQTITTKVATDTAKARVDVQTRYRTVIKKVPVYVTQAADADCSVPTGFVLLHNAAASGNPTSLPSTPGGPVDTPSGIPLSTVAETVTANYGVAYDWRAEAVGWRSWYAAQKAAWDKR